MTLLDKLVEVFGDAGLGLNADKTVLITTQAQPPPFLTSSTGAVVKVKERERGHKWFGCMLSATGSAHATLDKDYHLESASRPFFANVENFNVCVSPLDCFGPLGCGRRTWYKDQRLRYFDSVVSSVACFAGGQRTIYKEHIQTLDPHFRKFCRSIVGPPPHIDWTLEWHEVLHTWNERAAHFFSLKHTELVPNLLWCVLETGCSHCQTSHSSLDTESFALATCGAWAAKTPLSSKVEMYCRYQRVGRWEDIAQDFEVWKQQLNGF